MVTGPTFASALPPPLVPGVPVADPDSDSDTEIEPNCDGLYSIFGVSEVPGAGALGSNGSCRPSSAFPAWTGLPLFWQLPMAEDCTLNRTLEGAVLSELVSEVQVPVTVILMLAVAVIEG